MEKLADFLKDKEIKVVYSSDLQRAKKGADIIAGKLGLKPLEFEWLRELHLGRWEGLTRAEAALKFPEEANFSFQDLGLNKLKGGESLKELGERVLPAIVELVERHRGEHICIVAHGGLNRVVLCDAMGLPIENFFKIEQDYGGLNLIDYLDNGTVVVKMLNGGPNQEMKGTVMY
jgi:broad specificity phosphatase PhoE